MLSLALFIPFTLVGMVAIGLCVGLLSASEAAKDSDAERTYRAIVHRNGVSAPIPFAPIPGRVNAPGLVEVQPRRTQQPAAGEQPPAPLPCPASVQNPSYQAVSTVAEALELPLELAESPNEAEAQIIVERWETGLSMTKTIKEVWGINAGGGLRYKSARARYQHYLNEVTGS